MDVVDSVLDKLDRKIDAVGNRLSDTVNNTFLAKVSFRT
jgi:hypothetical protein